LINPLPLPTATRGEELFYLMLMIEHLWFWENRKKKKSRTLINYPITAILIVSVAAHAFIAYGIWEKLNQEKRKIALMFPTLQRIMTIERDVNLLKRGSTWLFVLPCDKKSKHGINPPTQEFIQKDQKTCAF